MNAAWDDGCHSRRPSNRPNQPAPTRGLPEVRRRQVCQRLLFISNWATCTKRVFVGANRSSRRLYDRKGRGKGRPKAKAMAANRERYKQRGEPLFLTRPSCGAGQTRFACCHPFHRQRRAILLLLALGGRYAPYMRSEPLVSRPLPLEPDAANRFKEDHQEEAFRLLPSAFCLWPIFNLLGWR